MISRLRGQVLSRDAEGMIEVETAGGVVYEAEVPLTVLQRIPAPGSPIELRTLQVVREDALDLYGFLEAGERELFRRLMLVKGVGPKLALKLLSAYAAPRLARALAEKDVGALQQVSGVGKKTAERLALELWDKVGDLAVSAAGSGGEPTPPVAQGAVAALVSLGYTFADADTAVRKALEDGGATTAEELIRKALQRGEVMSQRTEITTPEPLSEDQAAEPGLRPHRLTEFVGQEKVREALTIAVDAAKQRREPLDHVLFHGPPGLGKTTLAALMARELGVNLKTTSGPVLEKPADLVSILTNQRAGDVLFIDEIHRLRPIIEEFLYPAMEDWQIEIRLSDGPRAQTMTMKIEPFTLVGATTRFGLLTAPMRARFGIVQRLNFYPADELTVIVRRSAHILGLEVSDDGALEIARRSRGTPRVANRLLRRVRDFAQVRAAGKVDKKVAMDALALLDVDEYGLDEMDARVLKTIIEKFDGGPVGLSSLAVALGEDQMTLEEVYEPFLIQEGFLQRTAQGRKATRRAYERFGYALPGSDGGPGKGPATQSSFFEE